MKLILLFALILLPITSFQQSFENTKEYGYLYRSLTAHENVFFNTESLNKIKENLILPNGFQLKSLLSCKQQLMALEKGTGRIMLIDSLGRAQRLDATKYGGDRFGSFEFVYNDTLYSIGGYGFWHVNGLVRRFDASTKDWNVIITNRSIPAAIGVNAIFHFNPKVGKVFILHEPYSDENSSKKIPKEPRVSLAIFDLVTKKWNETNHEVSTDLMRSISDILELTHTDQSVLIHSKFNTNTLELDFENNQYYTLEPTFLTKYSTLSSQKSFPFYRSQNTKLFIGELLDTHFDTLETSLYRRNRGNITYKTASIERDSFVNNKILLVSICLNILLVGLLIYLIFGKSNQQIASQTKEPPSDARDYARVFTDLLDDTELQVVKEIWLNSHSGTNTSIDEINKLLCIDKRPYKIQNNLRAEALKLINKKFNDFTNTRDELIVRKRSDFDKRFFTYHVNERYVNKLSFK